MEGIGEVGGGVRKARRICEVEKGRRIGEAALREKKMERGALREKRLESGLLKKKMSEEQLRFINK